MSKKSGVFVGLAVTWVLTLTPALQGAQQEPVLDWHTYVGSPLRDIGSGVAVDPAGNVYVTGLSDASWGSPILPHSGGRDTFVAKLKSSGELEWHTFLGPTGQGGESAIAVDPSGNVVVVGTAQDVTPPVDWAWGHFVAKLSASGQVLWRRDGAQNYWGVAESVAVDASGNIYVGGWGDCFLGPTIHLGQGAWVGKLAPSGAELRDACLAPRHGEEYTGFRTLALDAGGNVYGTGRSTWNWGGPVNPHAGGYDAYVVKFTSNLDFLWTTFMGSSADDAGLGIAVDGAGNVYVTGDSEATWGTPINPHVGDPGDGFVAKLDGDGVRQWHTFLGTALAWAIGVDGDRNLYVTGAGGSLGGYIAVMHRDGSLQQMMSLPATLDEMALGDGRLYVAGETDYPSGEPVASHAGGWDAFVARVEPPPSPPWGTLVVTPGAAQPGEWVTVVVSTTPGANPSSTGLGVTANLSAFGYGSTHPLADDGTSGDATAGDGVFAFRFQLSDHASAGAVDVGCVVSDAQGRTSTGTGPLTVLPLADSDGDSLPDPWEVRFGLNKLSAAGDDGSAGDPDQDGVTNAQELAGGTHPRGLFQRYFAEGATIAFFETRFALLNPGSSPAHVQLRFLTAEGAHVASSFILAPHSRATLEAQDVAGLAAAEFATTVESDEPVVADRTMIWDRVTCYGAHAETAVTQPSLTWYLAEGATHSGFDLFYLLQNPNSEPAVVRVQYLRPVGEPLVKTYTLPPLSRTNIWVNTEEFAALGRALAATDVSAVIDATNGLPIIVERAMYLSSPWHVFNAGHESAGVTAPALQWFLAEGATGPYFDLFVLIANPSALSAAIEARYLLPDGQVVTKEYVVAATSRFNIWVNLEDARLANTAVSTMLTSTNGVPVIVERAMWWPAGPATWHEAHDSAGATVTGTRWGLGDGEDGGSLQCETYILVANTSAHRGSAKVTLLFEDGTTVERTFTLPATSRTNVAVWHEFPEARDRRFSAVVESLGSTPAQIVVERAIYWNAQGQFWAAGTNALATRLPEP